MSHCVASASLCPVLLSTKAADDNDIVEAFRKWDLTSRDYELGSFQTTPLCVVLLCATTECGGRLRERYNFLDFATTTMSRAANSE